LNDKNGDYVLAFIKMRRLQISIKLGDISAVFPLSS
jgi:hypothetical protein